MSTDAATPLSRLRLRALSIGQLTFAGFLLVLAIFVATGALSLASLRHLDTTFSEIQRLQGVGDFVAEIDRHMNAMRLAARDALTDPTASTERMQQASSALTELLNTPRLPFDPPQQKMAEDIAARVAGYRDALGALDRDVLDAQDRKIAEATAMLRAANADRRRELSVELRRTLSHARWRGIALNIAALLVGLVAAVYIVRGIAQPPTLAASSIGSLSDGAPDKLRRTWMDADTAREAALQALREQRLAEEGYRKLFEGSVDGIYVTTPDGQLLNANPALARIMGYLTVEELISGAGDVAQTIYLDPASRDAYCATMASAGFVREFEYQAKRADGEMLWLSDSATAVRDEAGQVVRYEGTVRDITDQKRAEAAVIESRRLLQQVIDTVPAVINVKDTERRYVLMNRYMAGIFAIEPGEAIGRTTSELMSRYGADKTDANDKRVLEDGRELGFYEEEYSDSSGAIRQWLVNKMPLRDADGAIDYIVTVALDIGERKRGEQEMRRAKDAAEAALRDLRETQNSLIEAEKLAALGRLVAGVAHEVNNPVGISLTVASSLERKVAQFAEEVARGELRRSSLNEFIESNRDATQQLVANLNRAAELVQSFKQVAADRNYSDQRVFDLADLTEQVVMSLKPGLRKQRVALQVDCSPNLTMNSYPGPYGQVLTNLFLNAVGHAFPEEGGTVSITAREAGEDHVRIVFEDDGRGMSDEVRRRAFDPFFTTRRDSGGTGLGLHIVFSIVTSRLGGRIHLTSSPGQGSRIEIVVPRNAPLEHAPA